MFNRSLSTYCAHCLAGWPANVRAVKCFELLMKWLFMPSDTIIVHTCCTGIHTARVTRV